jgi:hypothetical protein
MSKSPPFDELRAGFLAKEARNWAPGLVVYPRAAVMTYGITIEGKHYRLDLNRVDDRWSCRLDGRAMEVDAVLIRPDVLSLRVGDQAYEVKCERVAGETYLWVGSDRFPVEVRDPRWLRERVRAVDDQDRRTLTALCPARSFESW